MSKQPIRLRLRTAIFIAAAFSILLSIYLTVSYLTIKYSLTARGDSEVIAQLDSILSDIHSPSDEQQLAVIAAGHNSTGEAAISILLVRSDAPSKIVASSGTLFDRGMIDIQNYRTQKFPADISVNNSMLRILSRASDRYIIYGAINTLAFEEVFDSMLTTFFILLVAGIIVSFGIAFLTAGFALAPLNLLVRSATAIKQEPSHRDSRLPSNTTTREINELATIINDILAERDKNIAALRDFTADAAHELRTPLTILKGEMEVDLRTKRISEQERIALESNLEEVHRLVRIVEDLLILARADELNRQNYSQRLGSDIVQISDIVSTVISRLHPLINQKKILVERADQPIALHSSSSAVEQILYNILLNAVQYTPEGKKIRVISNADAHHRFVLSVSDEGIGVTPADVPFIFDRFWRADKSRSRAQGGSGLGLTIAKTLADQNNIILECISILGTGTTMRCIFPIL